MLKAVLLLTPKGLNSEVGMGSVVSLWGVNVIKIVNVAHILNFSIFEVMIV